MFYDVSFCYINLYLCRASPDLCTVGGLAMVDMNVVYDNIIYGLNDQATFSDDLHIMPPTIDRLETIDQ